MKHKYIKTELKHCTIASGAITLWVDVGTKGYFKDLNITKK